MSLRPAPLRAGRGGAVRGHLPALLPSRPRRHHRRPGRNRSADAILPRDGREPRSARRRSRRLLEVFDLVGPLYRYQRLYPGAVTPSPASRQRRHGLNRDRSSGLAFQVSGRSPARPDAQSTEDESGRTVGHDEHSRHGVGPDQRPGGPVAAAQSPSHTQSLRLGSHNGSPADGQKIEQAI